MTKSNPTKGLRPSLMFAPYIAELPNGGQLLIQIFLEDDKELSEIFLESVYYCTRPNPTHPWSEPVRMKRP